MSEPTPTVLAERTTQLLASKVPQWLLEAPPALRQRLRTQAPGPRAWPQATSAAEQPLLRAHARYRNAEQRLAPLLAQLASIEAFAEPLLVAALKANFGLEPDVRQTYLFNAHRVDVELSFLTLSQDPLVRLQGAMKAATQSLLAAALQNFEAWEATPGGMDLDIGQVSAIYAGYPIKGVALEGAQLAISPWLFAQVCRELDLGGQYQRLLDSLLSPPDGADQVPGVAASQRRYLFERHEHAAFVLQVQLALRAGQIDSAQCDAALALAAGQPATLNGVPLSCRYLHLWQVPLNGVVVIGEARGSRWGSGPVMVYLPDDQHAAFKPYASLQAFHQELRERMLQPGYLQFFERYVPARERNRLYRHLHEVFYPRVWNPTHRLYENVLDRQAQLHLREAPMAGAFISALLTQKFAVLRDDGLFHAVPTAAQDHKSLSAKLEYFAGLAFNALNIAAFAVPGLGEVMLGVMAAQLAYETYEGFESLAHDEQAQAWGYFMDVTENLALLAVLGSATAAAGGLPALEVPALLGQMREVQLADGSTRLWKPDLTPFAHDIVLPAGLKPDAAGLYQHQGKRWLALEGRTYALHAEPDGKAYRLAHPTRADAYQPALHHNGAGAWLHELDQPLQWQGLTLFRRLGPLGQALSDEAASQALRVSGTHEASVRRILAERLPPPGLLVDTVQRFAIDQDLNLFIAQLEAGYASADPQLQLQLLHELPDWPAGHSMVAGAGDVLVDAVNLLDGLPADADALAQEQRVQHLRGRLAGLARQRRGELFARRYAELQRRETVEIEVVQRAFAGLPTALVEELLAHASAAELSELRVERRVPLRLGQEARALLQQVRLSRVYEGLFLDAVSSVDTPRLLLHSLEALPGWSAELRIEVREGRFDGPLLDAIGPLDAPTRRVLLRETAGYRVHDGPLPASADFAVALLQALPGEQRVALGIPRRAQGSELRQALQAQPLLSRQALAEVLQMPPITPARRSPMRLADGRLGYPLSGGMAGYITEDSLLDKIRLLEFDDVFAEELLQQLNQASLSRAQISQRLDQLLDEQRLLRGALADWADASAREPAMLMQRQLGRQRLAEVLWRHWRATALPEVGRGPGVLDFDMFCIEDFPDRLPSFFASRTHALTLRNTSVAHWPIGTTALDLASQSPARVLRHFPQARALSLFSFTGSREFAAAVPGLAAELLPQLEALGLHGSRISLGRLQMQALRRFPGLRRLDLSESPIRFAEFDLDGLSLDFLGLDRVGLTRWPDALMAPQLSALREVSLVQNPFERLPEFLWDIGVDNGPRTRLRLTGTPLSRDTLTRLQVAEWSGSRYRFDFDVPGRMRVYLQALDTEHAVLRQALDDWSQASSSSHPANPARARTAASLLRFWYERTSACSVVNRSVLILDEAAIDDFPPSLPELFYQHVRTLQLSGSATNTAQLNRLLPQFTAVRSIRFVGSGMRFSALPQALEALPTLLELELSDLNQLIDQHAIDAFGRLPWLSRLDLDGNLVGAIDDVSGLALHRLDMLSLQRCGLDHWPHWLGQLMPDSLDALYLNDNHIVELPDWVLANPRSANSVVYIDLRGNPLSRESMTQAHLSESSSRSFEFGMDLPDDIAALRRHRHGSDTESASSEGEEEEAPIVAAPSLHEGWLDGPVERDEQRRAHWRQLAATGDAAQLLAFVDRMRFTADFRNAISRPELIERIWQVLNVVGQDATLRLTLNGMAEEPLRQYQQHATCPDGLRLEFNQMEVQVFIRQSLLEVPEANRGASLLHLTRRLYRLNELDRIARVRAAGRDEAEVRLAYRLHGALELDLPIPPRRMLYESAANVSLAELDQALRQVQSGEDGTVFLDYAVHRDFWQGYLRETYAERFRVLKEGFELQVQGLIDRYPEETTEQLGVRITALEAQLQADEETLLRELTVLEEQQA